MVKPYKLVKTQFGVTPIQMVFKDWFSLPVHPETFEDYRQDAKKILDELSTTMKPIGIQMLLAAMIDLTENGYHGTGNRGKYVEKTSQEVETEVE